MGGVDRWVGGGRLWMGRWGSGVGIAEAPAYWPAAQLVHTRRHLTGLQDWEPELLAHEMAEEVATYGSVVAPAPRPYPAPPSASLRGSLVLPPDPLAPLNQQPGAQQPPQPAALDSMGLCGGSGGATMPSGTHGMGLGGGGGGGFAGLLDTSASSVAADGCNSLTLALGNTLGTAALANTRGSAVSGNGPARGTASGLTVAGNSNTSLPFMPVQAPHLRNTSFRSPLPQLITALAFRPTAAAGDAAAGAAARPHHHLHHLNAPGSSRYRQSAPHSLDERQLQPPPQPGSSRYCQLAPQSLDAHHQQPPPQQQPHQQPQPPQPQPDLDKVRATAGPVAAGPVAAGPVAAGSGSEAEAGAEDEDSFRLLPLPATQHTQPQQQQHTQQQPANLLYRRLGSSGRAQSQQNQQLLPPSQQPRYLSPFLQHKKGSSDGMGGAGSGPLGRLRSPSTLACVQQCLQARKVLYRGIRVKVRVRARA